jgi:hypothetical protein
MTAKQTDAVQRAEKDLQPIWMTVLRSANCQAISSSGEHAISWRWIEGRAAYSNTKSETELILPLGVSLPSGHTIAIYWAPSATTYTVETYPESRLRVA